MIQPLYDFILSVRPPASSNDTNSGVLRMYKTASFLEMLKIEITACAICLASGSNIMGMVNALSRKQAQLITLHSQDFSSMFL